MGTRVCHSLRWRESSGASGGMKSWDEDGHQDIRFICITANGIAKTQFQLTEGKKIWVGILQVSDRSFRA